MTNWFVYSEFCKNRKLTEFGLENPLPKDEEQDEDWIDDEN